MTDQMAVVTFTSPTTATTLDITSTQITETFSAAILIFSKETTDDANNTHGVMGIGFIAPDNADSTESLFDVSLCTQMKDADVLRPRVNTNHSTAASIKANHGDAVGTIDIQAVYSASISGGVRLSFTTVAAGPIQTKGVAILFAGLSRASSGTLGATLAGVHESVGNSASGRYTPDVVVFLASDGTLNADHVDAAPTLGFALNNAALSQVSAYVNTEDVTEPTDSDGAVRSAKCAEHFTGGRVDQTAAITSFDATGFNIAASGNTVNATYLALKFSSAMRLAVANLALPSSSGIATYTDPGFAPKIVFGMSTLITSLDTLTDGATAAVAGFSAFSPTNARAYAVHHKEGINIPAGGNTSAHTRQGDYAALLMDHTGTLTHQATWSAATTSGFQLNFSTATAAGFLTALMIGPFESDETVSITESSIVEVSAFQANETVGISEGVTVYGTTTVFGEIVNILDGLVLDTTAIVPIFADRLGGTAQALAIQGETVESGAEMGTTAG